jgi:hypothetical protein
VASGTVDTDIQRNYVRENHVADIARAQGYDEARRAEMERLYGCFYSESQVQHRNNLLTMKHTTAETSEAMWNAVTSSHPKNEYLLGTEGAIIAKVLRRLPLWVMDIFFRINYYPGPYCYPEQGAVTGNPFE